MDSEVADRLADIHLERANASVEFFNRNVSLFEENQDLIAGWSDYGDSVESLLDSSARVHKNGIRNWPWLWSVPKKTFPSL